MSEVMVNSFGKNVFGEDRVPDVRLGTFFSGRWRLTSGRWRFIPVDCVLLPVDCDIFQVDCIIFEVDALIFRVDGEKTTCWHFRICA